MQLVRQELVSSVGGALPHPEQTQTGATCVRLHVCVRLCLLQAVVPRVLAALRQHRALRGREGSRDLHHFGLPPDGRPEGLLCCESTLSSTI